MYVFRFKALEHVLKCNVQYHYQLGTQSKHSQKKFLDFKKPQSLMICICRFAVVHVCSQLYLHLPYVRPTCRVRSGAVFRSKGNPLNPKDLCNFQLEVEDVCWKHRRSFGFKGKPHKSFRSTGLTRVPSMKSI